MTQNSFYKQQTKKEYSLGRETPLHTPSYELTRRNTNLAGKGRKEVFPHLLLGSHLQGIHPNVLSKDGVSSKSTQLSQNYLEP